MTNYPLRISACAVVAGYNSVKTAQSNRLCYKFSDFNYSLRFGEVGWMANYPLRISRGNPQKHPIKDPKQKPCVLLQATIPLKPSSQKLAHSGMECSPETHN